MEYEHKNPLVSETYLRVMMLDDGSVLIDDVTYGFVHTGTAISYWDKRYYRQDKETYTPIVGKNHTYYVYGCDAELAKKIAILYHAKRGKFPKWNFD